MNREEFLKNVCPKISMGLWLAIGPMSSCSKSTGEPTPPNSTDPAYDSNLAKTVATGYFVDGKTIYMNIQKSIYADLKIVGNFINDETNGLLLVRKNESTIVVFDNCCPHQGTRNRWSFSNNRFTCGNHGYAFGTDSGQIAPCNSNTPFGNLKSFSATLNKDLITVQLA
jgi:nitrite reductase/ring-hydroxylating ferredoxin subunit